MLAAACLLIATNSDRLPSSVDLRQRFEKYGLTVCQQQGPLCWDYTLIGLLELELATRDGRSTRLSPGYLSWAATSTDREDSAGSNFGRAYRGLKRYGIATLSSAGESAHRPDANTIAQARSIASPQLVWIRFWNDQDRLSADQMHAIKVNLAAGHAVGVGMRWPNSGALASSKPAVLAVPEPADVFDGHCVALVGYLDDAKYPGGGAFLFRNSWGEAWADGGYAWMPYELLNRCVNDVVAARTVRALSPTGPQTIRYAASDLKLSGRASIRAVPSLSRGLGAVSEVSLPASKESDQFSVTFDLVTAGSYELRTVITRAEANGCFQLSCDGRRMAVLDGAGPGTSTSEPLACGTVNLRSGTHTLLFRVTGRAAAATGYGIGIEEIILNPVRS